MFDKYPSFLEIYTERQLRYLLCPSFLHLLSEYLNSTNALSSSVLLKYGVELYYLAALIPDFYFLKQHSCTFTEALYQLSRKSYKFNLLFSGLLGLVKEYALEKIEQLYKFYCDELGLDHHVSIRDNLKSRISLVFQLSGRSNPLVLLLTIYPLLSGVFRLIDFIYKLNYLTFKSKYWSFWDHLFGIRYYRKPVESSNFFLKFVLPNLMILLRFIEWYKDYSYHSTTLYEQDDDEESISAADSNLNKLSFPEIASLTISGGICGICLSSFNNPTQYLPSGVVYCFTCLHDHLETNGNFCPQTKVKSNLEEFYLDMRKIIL